MNDGVLGRVVSSRTHPARPVDLRSLLPCSSNKRSHFLDLDPAVQRVVGTPPHDYWAYFAARFPALLLTAYAVAALAVRDAPRWSDAQCGGAAVRCDEETQGEEATREKKDGAAGDFAGAEADQTAAAPAATAVAVPARAGEDASGKVSGFNSGAAARSAAPASSVTEETVASDTAAAATTTVDARVSGLARFFDGVGPRRRDEVAARVRLPQRGWWPPCAPLGLYVAEPW